MSRQMPATRKSLLNKKAQAFMGHWSGFPFKGEENPRFDDCLRHLRELAAETNRLHSALQRITNLPLVQPPWRKGYDPNEKARKIAVVALGGDARKLTHYKSKTSK